VVPNGTDPERFAPRDATQFREELGLTGRPVALSVGRLIRRKGFDVLIDAFGRVLRRHPRAVLLIVGDGPERWRLEARARRSGVAAAVRFEGAVSAAALPRYYNLADVFAAPIKSEPPDVEGFGLVFLEASASGVAVVGPDRGGPCEAIVHGQTGLCVDPTSADAVANALTELFDHPDRARALGARGRAVVVERGTWDRAAQTLLGVITGLHQTGANAA
jgi:phosphatidylinositol alpha-1,6-mannosyltransferase